jgi:hypothetical protein
VVIAANASKELDSKDCMTRDADQLSRTYSYDIRGRVVRTIRRIFDEETEIETTYNEHDDKVSEVRCSRLLTDQIQETCSTPPLSPYVESRHSYQYDACGNWTERVTSCRTNPSGQFEVAVVSRRNLTYY